MAVYQVGGAALSVLPFTDVEAQDGQAVRYVCENGLMAGVSVDRFDPNGTLTGARRSRPCGSWRAARW